METRDRPVSKDNCGVEEILKEKRKTLTGRQPNEPWDLRMRERTKHSQVLDGAKDLYRGPHLQAANQLDHLLDWCAIFGTKNRTLTAETADRHAFLLWVGSILLPYRTRSTSDTYRRDSRAGHMYPPVVSLVGLDLCLFSGFHVRMWEEWVLRLLVPMNGRMEGLTRKWTPACYPTIECYC